MNLRPLENRAVAMLDSFRRSRDAITCLAIVVGIVVVSLLAVWDESQAAQPARPDWNGPTITIRDLTSKTTYPADNIQGPFARMGAVSITWRDPTTGAHMEAWGVGISFVIEKPVVPE